MVVVGGGGGGSGRGEGLNKRTSYPSIPTTCAVELPKEMCPARGTDHYQDNTGFRLHPLPRPPFLSLMQSGSWLYQPANYLERQVSRTG